MHAKVRTQEKFSGRNMKSIYFLAKTLALTALVLPMTTSVAEAQPSAKNQRVIDYWTPARMKQAIPRQLVIASKIGRAHV